MTIVFCTDLAISHDTILNWFIGGLLLMQTFRFPGVADEDADY